MEQTVKRVLHVQARDRFRIWLHYSDGAAGEVDLSDLVGKGVFRTGMIRDSSTVSMLPRTAQSPGTT